MPTMPPRFRPAHAPNRVQERRAYDARRSSDKPWRAWYKTARWQAIRSRQLRDQPLCCMCEAQGQLIVATICDHVRPHRGDAELFWRGPFQSLCKHHHDSDKHAAEMRAQRLSSGA